MRARSRIALRGFNPDEIHPARSRVLVRMDEIERAAIRDEGYDPDDHEVVAALDRVSVGLAELGRAVKRRPTRLACLWP